MKNYKIKAEVSFVLKAKNPTEAKRRFIREIGNVRIRKIFNVIDLEKAKNNKNSRGLMVVDSEVVLANFLINNDFVSYRMLNDFKERAGKIEKKHFAYFDVTQNSLISAVQRYSDWFDWDDEKIIRYKDIPFDEELVDKIMNHRIPEDFREKTINLIRNTQWPNQKTF